MGVLRLKQRVIWYGVKHAELQAQLCVLSHPTASAVDIQVHLHQNDGVDERYVPVQNSCNKISCSELTFILIMFLKSLPDLCTQAVWHLHSA